MTQSRENIKNQVIQGLTEALKNIPNSDQKIAELIELFSKSDAIIYCEDCNLIFYSGNAKMISEGDLYYDWKMLAFRHVWDTKHKVVVQLPYFGLAPFSLANFVDFIDPNDNTKIRYWITVERMRQRMLEYGDKRILKSNDENWDNGSVCYCSTCGKSHSNPKEACYCCFGTKLWMPYSEVDTIMVKQL